MSRFQPFPENASLLVVPNTSNMKKLASITSLLIVLFIGCKSDDKITPTEIWSDGCIAMVPDRDNYRITGGCCYEVVFRAVKFPAGEKRSINAVYFTGTGA